MSRTTPPRMASWKRVAALAAFAVSSAVAAVAVIVPSTDAELLLAHRQTNQVAALE